MAATTQSQDDSLRKYLEQKKFAQIMEALVVDLGEARPADVYTFMEEWAARRSEKRRSTATASQAFTAVSSSKTAWAAIEDKNAVGKLFFEILFTQHASLKLKLFNGVDIDAITPTFVSLLDRAITGDCKSEELRAVAAAASAGRVAGQRHFHYFLTSLLTALSISLGTAFAAVSEPLRVTLTIVLEDLMIGTGVKEAAPASPVPKAAASAEDADLAQQWAKFDGKDKVARTFFDNLFGQHPTLKKRLFKDIDTQALEPLVITTFTAALNGEISLEQLSALGQEHGKGRKANPRHFMYFLCAALGALATHVPNYKASVGPWIDRVTSFLEAVTVGAVSPADLEDEATNTTLGQMAASLNPGTSPVPAAGSGAGPKDEKAQVVASWEGLTAAQRTEVTDRFFELLFLQHASMKRKLFKGIEIDAIKPRFAAAFDGYLGGKVSAAEITKLAEEHGNGRGLEEHHFDYFLTALLGALSAVIGRDAFNGVAEPWRCVLTREVAKAVRDGAPPAAGTAFVTPTL